MINYNHNLLETAMFIRSLFLTLALVTAVASSWAVGALFVRPMRSVQNYELISIKSYDATVRIQDHVATTHVDQTFVNEMNLQVEATFIFPLPAGAMVTDLYYWFNGKRYHANVREKKEAQAAYDAKIRRILDPALLQEIGDNVYKLNIAPIEPRSDVRFEITYTEILPYALSTANYVHLLKATGLSPKPLERISIKIEANTQNTWKSINVPFYGATSANSITAISPNKTMITFGDENYMPTRNYSVQLRTNREAVEMSTLTYVPVPSDSFGIDPFFMSWVLPPDEDSRPLPRSIVIVADVSSSMEGARIAQLRVALTAFLDQLTPTDYFNIITFSTNVIGFSKDLLPATLGNIESARVFVRTRSALGLTNFSDALQAGLSQTFQPNSAQVAIFLTDGEPSWGEVREPVILDSVRSWNKSNVRIYPIAVGTNLKLSLLNNLASTTGGFVTEIENDDSIAIVVKDHLNKISMPSISNIELAYGALQTFDVLPRVIPNTPVGGRVTQHGRYATGGLYPVTLTGVIQHAPFSLTKDVFFGDLATNNRAVAGLWARIKIEDILNDIKRLGERKELIDAVIELSKRFNILTKYTALYADPDDPGTTGFPEDERPVESAAIWIAPNPVADIAHLSVFVPESKANELVVVEVRDQLGRLVASLFRGQCVGMRDFDWDCRNSMSQRISSGVYYLVLQVGDSTTTSMFIVQ